MALIPMYSLCGLPTKEEILKEMEYFRDEGIKTVIIYPRSGCEIEYMSEQWLDVCEIITEFARDNGMKIWLYDDFNWPSGSCKGSVTGENPRFVAKKFRVEKDGVKTVSAEKDFPSLYSPFLTDILNYDAVGSFIEKTHEVYYRRLKKHFGETIEAIFTDEPGFAYAIKEPNEYPYYEGICEDYEKLYGTDLKEDLFKFHNGDPYIKFAEKYYGLLGKRFGDCYIGSLAKWCFEHKISLTGHALYDDNLFKSIKNSGDLPYALSKMQIPGIDHIRTDLKETDYILYSTAQRARLDGKEHAMDEIFSLGPVSMPAAKKRQVLYRAAAYGIDKYVIAISQTDARGSYSKVLYFNNFTSACPDGKFLRYLNSEAEEAAKFSAMEPVFNVNIRYPYSEYLRAIKSDTESLYDDKLNRFMDLLTDFQIAHRFIGEDEKSDIPTVSLKEGKFFEETSGLCFAEPETMADYLNTVVENDIKVCELSGITAKGLVVFRYKNGKILVTDRARYAHRPRRLVLCTGLEKREFTLECFGVYTGENEREMVKTEHVTNAFAYYNGVSLKRLYFNGHGVSKFTLAEDMQIELNACCYPQDSQVSVDGKEVKFESVSENLTSCFNCLYKKAVLELKAGEHTVFGNARDLPYLPAVILAGEFNPSTMEKSSGKYAIDEGLEFYDNVSVKFEAEAPFEKGCETFLEFDDNMLSSELIIDGESVASCPFAPYRLTVPEKFAGKTCTFEIKFYSTMAPLFGKTRDCVAESIRSAPASEPEILKVENLRFSVMKHS